MISDTSSAQPPRARSTRKLFQPFFFYHPAAAGALDINVAKAAQLAGIAGLEFFCGVPGTLGGALRMNAGAYERETKNNETQIPVNTINTMPQPGQRRVIVHAFHHIHEAKQNKGQHPGQNR